MSKFTVEPIFDGIHSFRIVPEDEASEANTYLAYLATCGRSGYTLRSYAQGLAHFLNWLDRQDIDLEAVDTQHIGEYIGEFARSKKGGASRPKPELADQIHPKTGKSYAGTQRRPGTINHRLSVLTSFFAHCIHRDDLRGEGVWHNRVNPVAPSARQDAYHGMAGRDQPRRRRQSEFRRRKTRQIPKHLSPELAEQFITQAGSWRDKAILTLLLRTGQRIGDWSDLAGRHGILGMSTADVDEVSGTIVVRLKVSRDEHRVPVTDDFWPIYHQYLEHERGKLAAGSALWITFGRNKGKPLAYATFESALRYIGRKLGVNVNAHMFRHTLAQGILETTGNLKVAQEILGHSHVSTTADQYMYVDETAMVKALVHVKEAFEVNPEGRVQEAASTEALEAGQVSPDQSGYAFAYDALTIEELEAICGNQRAGEAGGLIE